MKLQGKAGSARSAAAELLPLHCRVLLVVVNHKYKLRNQRGTINANILLLFCEVYVHKTDVEMHRAFGG